MAESIRERMTVNPRSLERGSIVTEAARLMRDEDAGLMPVLTGTTIVGTVTDGDSAILVAAATGCSPETATIEPLQERGSKTREVVEGIST
jgi:CBS domain-containing protein